MLGFFSSTKDIHNYVKAKEISFVSIPDDISKDEIKVRFSKKARDFADALNVDKVYLNYGKDDFIEYEYTF